MAKGAILLNPHRCAVDRTQDAGRIADQVYRGELYL